MEQGPARRRLFVALMLGEELGSRAAAAVRQALSIRRDQDPPSSLRLYGGRDLHLTLFFLGAVADERVEPLAEALGTAVAGLEAPTLELGAAGAFPDARRPRVLWLGLRRADAGPLEGLVAAVRGACEAQGFEADPRPFAAHVTVGRVRADDRRRRRGPAPPATVPEGFYRLDPGLAWQPGEVALVESVPGGSGAPGDAYRPLRTWTLASGRG